MAQACPDEAGFSGLRIAGRFCLVSLSLVVAACGPIPVTLDNPKDGDVATLSVDQTLTFRLTNGKPQTWIWRWDEKPLTSLKMAGAEVKAPSDDAGLQLETISFVATVPGAETLSLTYAPIDGGADPKIEQVKIAVTVK